MNKSELLKIAKPVIMNTDEVRATLYGRKTQFRQINKDANKYCEPLNCFINNEERTYAVQNYGDTEHTIFTSLCEVKMPICKGDILYVRETWQRTYINDGTTSPKEYYYNYVTDNNRTVYRWNPSITMPKDAARLLLRVTDIRVERLQDITAEDCISEGIEIDFPQLKPTYISLAYTEMRLKPAFRDAFSKQWDIKNKKRLDRYGWSASPWVWVYCFEVIN